jgi:mRNA interferase MazF
VASDPTAGVGARRGEIWAVDWSPGRGSEQTGLRPALVIQTDAATRNPRYPNIIVLAVSTSGRAVPFHIPLNPSTENGLREASFVKCEQILTISKDRLRELWGRIEDAEMAAVERAVAVVLGLPRP